ncbi:MAG: metallophosphoesterase family protein [Polyangia bacterium]
MSNKIVLTEEEGTWSAHDPDVPGVYGLGPTREQALADLEEALALLAEYDARQAAEDADDIRAAEASRKEILAGGVLLTQEEMLARFESQSVEDREDVDLAEARLGSQTLAHIEAGKSTLVPLEEAMLQRGLDSSATENDASADVKIGIVSDIHGDFDSLDRAIGWFRWMEIEKILCPGDLLDVEPFGEEVVQRIKAENVICIRGNHERWALERRRRKPDLRRSGMQACELSDLAGGGTELSHEALKWLATLPSHWESVIADVRIAMWHARPGSDMEGIEADKATPALRRRLLEQAGANVLIVGHTHDPFALVAGEGLILNAGACCSRLPAYKQAGGVTVAGFRPATFGVLELPSKRFRVFRAFDGVPV